MTVRITEGSLGNVEVEDCACSTCCLKRERDDARMDLTNFQLIARQAQQTADTVAEENYRLRTLLREVTLAVADGESNLFDVVTVDIPTAVWKQILAALEGR